MGYIIIYRRYRNRVAEMLRGFLFVWMCGDYLHIYFYFCVMDGVAVLWWDLDADGTKNFLLVVDSGFYYLIIIYFRTYVSKKKKGK